MVAIGVQSCHHRTLTSESEHGFGSSGIGTTDIYILCIRDHTAIRIVKQYVCQTLYLVGDAVIVCLKFEGCLLFEIFSPGQLSFVYAGGIQCVIAFGKGFQIIDRKG